MLHRFVTDSVNYHRLLATPVLIERTHVVLFEQSLPLIYIHASTTWIKMWRFIGLELCRDLDIQQLCYVLLKINNTSVFVLVSLSKLKTKKFSAKHLNSIIFNIQNSKNNNFNRGRNSAFNFLRLKNWICYCVETCSSCELHQITVTRKCELKSFIWLSPRKH